MQDIQQHISWRPLKRSDNDIILQRLRDPIVTRYVKPSEGKRDKGTQTRRYTGYRKLRSKKEKIFFMICWDKKPIGWLGLSHIDHRVRKAELFITIGEKSLQGKGVGIASVNFITHYAFTKLHLHKIYLSVSEGNKSAIACYTKAGFVIEGLQKDEEIDGEVYENLMLMAKFDK